MTLANYTDLKASLALWLDRTDLTTQIVDFITIAESRINRVLRLIHQETTATITMTVGQQYDALPTGFIDVLDWHYSDDLSTLEQLPLNVLNEQFKTLSSTTSRPRYYTITNRFEYDYAPDDTYATTIHYLKRWDIASDSTNWLLTNHPDVYLYCSLAAAEPYIMNDERVILWKQLAEEALNEVQHLTSRTKNQMRVDTAFLTIPNGNIFTDV